MSVSKRVRPSVESFVQECVAEALPHTPYSESELLRAVTGLVRWYVAARKGSVVRRGVFGRESIVEHTESGLKSFGPATRTNRRSQLLRVAEALLGPEFAPPALPAMQASDPTVPYTAEEEATLTEWAKREKRAGRGSDALVLLGLGMGAGLSAAEVMNLRAGDVELSSGAIIVRVSKGRVREVPVLRRWEQAIARRASQLDPGEFLFKPGRTGAGKNLISNFVARTAACGVHPQTQRMRSTWLVTHMAAGTHLPELIEAAGVDSLEAFTRYLSFVPRVSNTEAVASLRGAAAALAHAA